MKKVEKGTQDTIFQCQDCIKIAVDQGDDYTAGFKENYKMIVINLSKQ